jgi:hypothetical protein
MYKNFVVLTPGEAAGDPELGGWRPLPKRFFQKLSPLSFPVSSISLEQAVHLINFEVRYLRLLRAVQRVTFNLLQTQNSFAEGGSVLEQQTT